VSDETHFLTVGSTCGDTDDAKSISATWQSWTSLKERAFSNSVKVQIVDVKVEPQARPQSLRLSRALGAAQNVLNKEESDDQPEGVMKYGDGG